MSTFLMIYIIFIVFLISSAIKIVRENERIAIFRLGHLYKIVGPGLVLSIPIVDKIIRINLDKTVPNWNVISKDDLNDKIKKIVLSQLK
jgi:regulator of protease activity HflC (stomatin/prohibitin superfamily)